MAASTINVTFRRRTDRIKAGGPSDRKTDQQADD
jgi:hypothetical protein